MVNLFGSEEGFEDLGKCGCIYVVVVVMYLQYYVFVWCCIWEQCGVVVVEVVVVDFDYQLVVVWYCIVGIYCQVQYGGFQLVDVDFDILDVFGVVDFQLYQFIQCMLQYVVYVQQVFMEVGGLVVQWLVVGKCQQVLGQVGSMVDIFQCIVQCMVYYCFGFVCVFVEQYGVFDVVGDDCQDVVEIMCDVVGELVDCFDFL